MIKKLLLGLSVIAFAGAGVAIAQQSGIKRTPLQKLDFRPATTPRAARVARRDHATALRRGPPGLTGRCCQSGAAWPRQTGPGTSPAAATTARSRPAPHGLEG